MPSPDGLITSREICQDAIVSRHVATGALDRIEMFGGDIGFVDRVTTLGVCTPNELGHVAYLVPDGALYKCDGTSWVNIVDLSAISPITSTQIEDGAITTPKLAANAVTAAKIAANTITANQIAANTITAGEIAANTVTAAEIAANAIVADLISGGTINTTEIVVGSTLTLGGSGVVRTAETGQRVELNALAHDRIRFYSGDTEEAHAANIYATDLALYFDAPQHTLGGSWAMSWIEARTNRNLTRMSIQHFGTPAGGGIPHVLIDETVVIDPDKQIVGDIRDIDVVNNPNKVLLPGILVEMNPPTWKADTTDPSAYEDASVGWWIRVGNLVWFSLLFHKDDDALTATDRGSGDYYWNPATDGAPPVDMSLIDSTHPESLVCGSAIAHPAATGQSYDGTCEIDKSNGGIYVRWNTTGMSNRFGRSRPLIWGAGNSLVMSGTYVTADS